LAIVAPLVLIGVAAAALSRRHVEHPAPIVPVAPARLRTAAVDPTRLDAAQEPPKAAAAPPVEKKTSAPERKPYPFKLDPSSSNAAVRTWAALRSSRVSLDFQGSMLQVAHEVQSQTGIIIHCSPGREQD